MKLAMHIKVVRICQQSYVYWSLLSIPLHLASDKLDFRRPALCPVGDKPLPEEVSGSNLFLSLY